LSIKRKQNLIYYINKQYNKNNININITFKIVYNASNYIELIQQLNRYILQTKIKTNNRVIIVITMHKNNRKKTIKLN